MTYWDVFKFADSIVVPVNNKGIMGAGLARAIWPHLPEDERLNYIGLCKESIGGDASFGLTERWIYAFTKEAWWEGTRINWVESILQRLILMGTRQKTVLLCKLGCGLGGLNWEKEIKPLYDHYIPLMAWKEVYVL